MRPLSGVSGHFFLQFGAMGRFYAPLRRLRGESRRNVPARALRAAMGPLSGVSGLLFTDGGNGALLCPSGAVVGIAWGVRAGRPPGLSERQWGPSPGFQSTSSTVWGNGAFLCPSGGIVGIAWGSLGGCGGEEDCRVVPAGEFPGLRRGSARRRRRPWRPGRRGPPAVLYGVWGPALPTGLMACRNARSFDRTLSERTDRWRRMWGQVSGSRTCFGRRSGEVWTSAPITLVSTRLPPGVVRRGGKAG